MIRILYIERQLRPDRSAVVYDQIQRLAAHVQHHVLSVWSDGGEQPQAPDLSVVRAPFFPKIEAVKGWLFVHAARVGVEKLLRQRRFDLCHAHFAYPEGLAARQIGRRYGIPYVITGRGDDILIYPQRNAYLRRTVGAVLSDCAGFLGVSDCIVARARQLGLRTPHVLVQPDGILTEHFWWRPEVEEERRTDTVLFAGSLLPVKNVQRLAKAFALLAHRRHEVRLRIAGEGPLQADMADILTRNQLADRAVFLGQLPAPLLAEEMRRATVLVLPSVSEGWGNVITEAMACGTPVVGANIGAIPEQITKPEYGLLCDPLDEADIAAKLEAALLQPWDHPRLAAYGQRYTRDAAAAATAALYDRIIFSPPEAH